MRARTDNGWINARVGQAFCGVGFFEVTFTAEDFAVIGFDEWLHETVMPRMYPETLEREL